jgi:predicted nuclease of predicted toxin-antitoxin system
VRFLLDANLSPALAQPLRDAGHDAVHVVDLEMLAATDEQILARAESDGSTIITADTDFPMMLALRAARRPSVVLLRQIAELPRLNQAALLTANLPSVLDDLERGAIVSLSPTRLAVRALPVE